MDQKLSEGKKKKSIREKEFIFLICFQQLMCSGKYLHWNNNVKKGNPAFMNGDTFPEIL